MSRFYSWFPKIAARETRSGTVLQPGQLPVGGFGFIELFGDDPGCDCWRVMIQVTEAANPSSVLATMNQGLEGEEFYTRWICYGEQPNDAYAPDITARASETRAPHYRGVV
jgi:hypothetical protein